MISDTTGCAYCNDLILAYTKLGPLAQDLDRRRRLPRAGGALNDGESHRVSGNHDTDVDNI